MLCNLEPEEEETDEEVETPEDLERFLTSFRASDLDRILVATLVFSI